MAAVDLADVQGNILRGYRKTRVRHLVLEVIDAARARAWVGATAGADRAAAPAITPGEHWGDRPPDVCFNLGVTFAGMTALGIPDSATRRFPEAFREGMAARAATLGDWGDSAPEHWLPWFRPGQPVHLVATMHADTVELLLEDETVLKSITGVGSAMDDYRAVEGDGLDADYFNDPDLATPAVVERVDEAIGFDLQGAAPAPGVLAIGFSVRWTGHLYVPATGEVTFRVRCTDGIQVIVNGAVVFDEWRDQPETEFNATLRLDGGEFYPLEVRYYNKTSDALLELLGDGGRHVLHHSTGLGALLLGELIQPA